MILGPGRMAAPLRSEKNLNLNPRSKSNDFPLENYLVLNVHSWEALTFVRVQYNLLNMVIWIQAYVSDSLSTGCTVMVHSNFVKLSKENQRHTYEFQSENLKGKDQMGERKRKRERGREEREKAGEQVSRQPRISGWISIARSFSDPLLGSRKKSF